MASFGDFNNQGFFVFGSQILAKIPLLDSSHVHSFAGYVRSCDTRAGKDQLT